MSIGTHTLVEQVAGATATAADIFERVRHTANAAFLDSALPDELGSHSIIGLNPYAILEERLRDDGAGAGADAGAADAAGDAEGATTAVENGVPIDASFEERMAQLLADAREDNPTDLPLISGAIGFLSYDYGRKFEGIASRHRPDTAVPLARFAFYDNLIIEDVRTGSLSITACGRLRDPRESLREIRALVQAAPPAPVPAKGDGIAPCTSPFGEREYRDAVAAMREHMRAGDIYVANMTQRFTADLAPGADAYDIYRYLRTHNPAPMAAYLASSRWQVCCASMERFIRVRDGVVETRPIKGTRPRGATPDEDRRNREELRASEKDRSELLMIVDLERNDLSRVCEPGSVEVTGHFDVREYAKVFHLISTVQGRLRPGLSALDLMETAFPGGSITGAPKIRAMEIIDELERSPRGLYTGSIGYLSSNGDCDFNIVIRTAVCHDGRASIGAGGGITYESDTQFEYDETVHKARAVLEAIAQGRGSR